MIPSHRSVFGRFAGVRRAAGCMIGAFATAALVAVGACKGDRGPSAGAPAAVEPVAVRLSAVERRTVPRTEELTGTLFGTEEATISAKVPGRVESIARDVGDVLAPGDELARLERREYALALELKRTAVLESLASLGLAEMPPPEFDLAQVPTVVKARLQAQNAEARHRRAEQLWKQDPPLISEQDYSDLRTAWDVARSDAEVAMLNAKAALAEARSREADLAMAEQRLDDTTLHAPRFTDGGHGRAPVNYAVAARLVSVGENVAIGAPMFRLVASDPIKFRGDAPERFVGEIVVGQPASLRVEAFADAFPGAVARVNPQVNPRNRTFQVEIEVPNADGRLRAGSFGRAAVVTREDPGATFVPEGALVVFAGVTKVFSMRDGKAIEHRVETGRRAEGMVELVGAPADLDRVIVSGQQRLATGTPVREASAPAAK